MKHHQSVTRSSKMYGSWPAINQTIGCPPARTVTVCIRTSWEHFISAKITEIVRVITHEKRDCRQWCRTYLTYVKDPTWLLNVRDFSLYMTRCHILATDIVHRGSSLTFRLSNGSGISANCYSTVSTSDMKHRESVTRSSKMYGSWPAINRTIGCPPQGQSRSALGRHEVTLFWWK